jgi:hypothetical protein
MSDARNSSGNIRGGGAKQTGGSGRNTRGGGSQGGSKNKLDALLGGGEIDRNAEAKRFLQLQIMSKKLALQVKAAILKESVETGEGPRTEAEYERFDIPMPDPDTAMKRLKAMKEFTKDWYDADFREQWLDSVCEVWAKELQAKYAAFWAAEKAHRDGGAAAEGEAMSIEELEVMILSPDTSGEERKRLKNKLKKRRQKENKKKPQSDSKGEDDAGAEKLEQLTLA